MNFDIKSVRAAMRKKFAKATTENTVEDYLCAEVRTLGGTAVKLMYLPGWPDRMVLLPRGFIMFVELKRPHGGKDEPLQPRVQRYLRSLGFIVIKAHTKEAVRAALKEHYL